MGINLTSEDAKSAGHKKIDTTVTPIDKSTGTIVDGAQVGYICYIGPCSGSVREVCYMTDSGCDDCYYESDSVCT